MEGATNIDIHLGALLALASNATTSSVKPM
jgi:hypothetical protein